MWFQVALFYLGDDDIMHGVMAAGVRTDMDAVFVFFFSDQFLIIVSGKERLLKLRFLPLNCGVNFLSNSSFCFVLKVNNKHAKYKTLGSYDNSMRLIEKNGSIFKKVLNYSRTYSIVVSSKKVFVQKLASGFVGRV